MAVGASEAEGPLSPAAAARRELQAETSKRVAAELRNVALQQQLSALQAASVSPSVAIQLCCVYECWDETCVRDGCGLIGRRRTGRRRGRLGGGSGSGKRERRLRGMRGLRFRGCWRG